MSMHVLEHGDPAKLAAVLRTALAAVSLMCAAPAVAQTAGAPLVLEPIVNPVDAGIESRISARTWPSSMRICPSSVSIEAIRLRCSLRTSRISSRDAQALREDQLDGNAIAHPLTLAAGMIFAAVPKTIKPPEYDIIRLE
jgi:hypothetical protein